MTIPSSYAKSSRQVLVNKICLSLRLLFIIFVSIFLTFNIFAQEEDSDFLDKVLEEKPKKVDPKKLQVQPQQVPALRDKKKKDGKNSKKNSKIATRPIDPSKKTKPNPTLLNSEATNSPLPQLNGSKLNLEYWVQEDLAMSPQNIPGFEELKADNIPTPLNPNIGEKPIEKKPIEKPIEKDAKSGALITFLNEYKKIIFIFAAIIIFAIYRLRYAGSKNYNNSGRIFSKFRNK